MGNTTSQYLHPQGENFHCREKQSADKNSVGLPSAKKGEGGGDQEIEQHQPVDGQECARVQPLAEQQASIEVTGGPGRRQT